MRTHHAKLSMPCSDHREHVVHLISRDDTSWLMARLLLSKLRSDGFPADIAVWLEGDEHVRLYTEYPDPLDWGQAPWDES